MPSDDTPEKDRSQQAPLGKPRAVLTAVPDALWNSEFWDVALPSWAETVDDPPSQFLAIVVDRVGRQREAIAELKTMVRALRVLHSLAKRGADKEDLVRRIDMVGLRTRLILAGLDKP